MRLGAAVLLLLFLTPSLRASEAEFIEEKVFGIEVAFGPSYGRHSGWLTDEREVWGTELSFRLPVLGAHGARFWSFYEFASISSHFNTDTGDFPLSSGERAWMSAFALVPNLAFWSGERSAVFVGIGPVLVSLSQEKPKQNDVTYGTYLLQAGWLYRLSPRWTLSAKWDWMQVEQTVSDQKSFFGVSGHAIQLGYLF